MCKFQVIEPPVTVSHPCTKVKNIKVKGQLKMNKKDKKGASSLVAEKQRLKAIRAVAMGTRLGHCSNGGWCFP